MKRYRALAALLLLALSGPVFAQTLSELSFGVRFENAPVVEERNVLVVEAFDVSGALVPGLEDSMEIEFRLGEIMQRFDVEPGERVGEYLVEVVPTAPGDWFVRVVVERGNNIVNRTYSCAEEDFVCPRERETLGFPKTAVESAALDERLGNLEGGVANALAADPLGFYGVIAGTLGLLAGGVALMRRRDI